LDSGVEGKVLEIDNNVPALLTRAQRVTLQRHDEINDFITEPSNLNKTT
jgi:hypothetical protein